MLYILNVSAYMYVIISICVYVQVIYTDIYKRAVEFLQHPLTSSFAYYGSTSVRISFSCNSSPCTCQPLATFLLLRHQTPQWTTLTSALVYQKYISTR